MKIGIPLSYAGSFTDTVAELAEHERAGLDVVYVPEAYSFDAVSRLGFLAARTERIQLASAILPVYTRTPTLLAMTAAGLDHVSGGRFVLGLGSSGPQVVEGFHGVPFDAPLERTREVVQICRAVWRRERLQHSGRCYRIPLPADQGTGLGKPLKLINTPHRERIPVLLAAIGPRNVALAAEIAEYWQPLFYLPEQADAVWAQSLAAGTARRDPNLGPLHVVASAPLAITEDRDRAQELLDTVRPHVALYVGGMGAPGRNFYNDLVCRYGFEGDARTVQQLYLDGRPQAAAAALPQELIELTSLIGPESFVRERLDVYRAAGVGTISVTLLAPTAPERTRLLGRLRDLTPDPT